MTVPQDALANRRKNTRLTGPLRDEAIQTVTSSYASGQSIRQIASSTKLSIGLVRSLLLEAGVALRPRGGGGRPSGQA